MACLRIIVKGVLRGLGYLGYVYVLAVELKIRGWARYIDDGVEVVAIGDEDILKEFIERLGHPDMVVVVKEVYAEECPEGTSINVSSFDILL